MVFAKKPLVSRNFHNMRLLPLFVALALMLAAPALRAQTGPAFWVQIEAQPGLADAETRARAWSQVFPDVAGFRMASGWYAVTLGPYSREDALARLNALRADNMIPADSFLAAGEVYRIPFWPVGGVQLPAEPPATAPAPAETVEVAPLAPAPEAPAVPRAPAAETLADARAAEARLTPDERQDIQRALQWAGFYTSAIDGAFGPGTRGSITAWQSARGHEPTGFLTTAQRQDLIGERARVETALGIETVTEPEAGIEIALPLRHLSFDGYAPPFVQFAERDGSGLRAVLISQPGDARALRGLYDLLQTLDAVPPQGNRALSERSFSIEAANDRIASLAYAELSQGLIKGYMLVWEPRSADLAAQALPLMKASFRSIGSRALDPNLVPLDGAVQAAMLAGMEVRRPALSRTGVYVTPQGAVLTTAEAVQECDRITLDRVNDARVSQLDAGLGLALLTPDRTLAAPGVAAFATALPRVGSEVALAGYSYGDALPAPALTFGTLAQAAGLAGEPDLRRLAIPALPGDAGGPVLDGTGAVLGVLLAGSEDPSRVLPPDVAFARAADSILPWLTAAGVTARQATPEGALAPEDLTERAVRMTVLVNCWK